MKKVTDFLASKVDGSEFEGAATVNNDVSGTPLFDPNHMETMIKSELYKKAKEEITKKTGQE